jgi:hypothetical protein
VEQIQHLEEEYMEVEYSKSHQKWSELTLDFKKHIHEIQIQVAISSIIQF